MKFLIALAFLPVLAFANTPNYAANPQLAVGEYKALADYNCRDGISECEEAEVFMKAGKPYIRMGGFFEFGDDKRVMPLLKTASGALVFSQSFNDDCDSNGCVNIDNISGVVYAKKVGRKFVPSLKATIDTTCGWGDDEACPHNLSETTVVRMSK
jgi:hypothetical protein